MENQESLGDLVRKALIYTRYGREYRKLDRDEIIEEGAMHSYCDGELQPMQNPGTVGDVPGSFSYERDFYNPIEPYVNPFSYTCPECIEPKTTLEHGKHVFINATAIEWGTRVAVSINCTICGSVTDITDEVNQVSKADFDQMFK